MATRLAIDRRRNRGLGRASGNVDRHYRRAGPPGRSRGLSRRAYQIVSHKCRDWGRRDRRRREATMRYAEHGNGRRSCTTPRPPKRTAASLKEALEQMSGPDRAILSLRYEEQFHTAEIAATLAIPEGTVKSRLYYARKRLRKQLEKDDE